MRLPRWQRHAFRIKAQGILFDWTLQPAERRQDRRGNRHQNQQPENEGAGNHEAVRRDGREKRKATTLPGTITFPNMRVQVPCTILDMSGSGAQLGLTEASQKEFGDIDHLPDRIVLIMRADRMQVDSQIVWRRGVKVGVRFLVPPRPWTYALR